MVVAVREGAPNGYSARGAARELWQTRDFETMVSGPAETGKTYGCLQYANALLWKYPGAQGVMARKTYAALVGSALRTYQKIIGESSPIRPYGGEKPEWFQYPNGSRLWVVGLDNAGKALSSERDFIYINQAEELALSDWETLTTRCTGRGATMPYTRIFGDCNPSYPQHWIKQRAKPQGPLRLLESRHEDNPALYTDAGELTPQGAISIGILDQLTGTRRERLRNGKWVAAEGQVYEGWDRALHVIQREIPAEWTRYRSIDFGFTNPFVCQWWAEDPDGRLYLYREIYRTQRLVAEHAKEIQRLSVGEVFRATIADHDAEDRATLHAAGIITVPAWKAVSPGIQAVQKRLQMAGDRKPRLFVLENALVEADPVLIAAHRPVCTEQEFDAYIWPPGVDGKPLKEAPVKDNDHGMDAGRYLVCYVDQIGRRSITVL